MHKAEPYATLICHSLIAIPAVAFDVALPFRYTAQSPAPGYTADCGYGFEAGDGNYFSVKVPEGNYNVTATVTWVTSMHRRNFGPDGKVRNTLGDYPEAVRQTAAEERVALIDLHSMSAAFYEALGAEKSPSAFGAGGRDGTHHSAYGAYELAKCVVNGMRAARLDLVKYLVDDVPAFDPAHPDSPDAWNLPASPRFSNRPPRGN